MLLYHSAGGARCVVVCIPLKEHQNYSMKPMSSPDEFSTTKFGSQATPIVAPESEYAGSAAGDQDSEIAMLVMRGLLRRGR